MLVLGFVPLYWVKLIQLLGISYFIDVCINQLAYTTENEQLKPRIWWLGSDDLSLQFGDFLSSILIFRGVVWSPKKIHPSSNDRTEVFQCWRVEIGSCIGSFGGMICLRVKWTKGWRPWVLWSLMLQICCSPEPNMTKEKQAFEYVSPIKTDEFPLPC